MTQYQERVRKQALKLEAEEWANEVAGIHAHSLSSMWYDDHPEDTADGGVVDTTYNDGRIERSKNGKVIRVMGKRLTGDMLVDAYEKFGATQKVFG